MALRLSLSASRGKGKAAAQVGADQSIPDKFEKMLRLDDPITTLPRILFMDNSASPLMVLLIATLVVMALGVHAVFAADPLYGSNSNLTILSDAIPQG